MSGDRYKTDNQGSVYFLTLTVVGWLDVFTRIEYKDVIPESRRAWLLWYFEREGRKDKRITKYKFWKEDNHAIELDCIETKMMDQKINYIHENPLKDGIVDDSCDYLYSSARNYGDQKGLLENDFL